MRRSIPPLLLAVALVTSGCAGRLDPSRAPSDERAVDAVDRSQAALANVTAYRASIDGRVQASNDGEEVTADVTGTYAVNVSTREMNATGQLEEPGRSGVPCFHGSRSTYVENYGASTECARIGWTRQNLSESHPWTTYTPAEQQLALSNRTHVSWQGTETVDGIETAVIVAYPTAEKLLSVPGIEEREMMDFDESNIKNATVTVWLDTRMDRPVKARREITAAKGGATATAVATFRFTDYDEPTTVTAPVFDGPRWEMGC
jgi:hypothetical protein